MKSFLVSFDPCGLLRIPVRGGWAWPLGVPGGCVPGDYLEEPRTLVMMNEKSEMLQKERCRCNRLLAVHAGMWQ